LRNFFNVAHVVGSDNRFTERTCEKISWSTVHERWRGVVWCGVMGVSLIKSLNFI